MHPSALQIEDSILYKNVFRLVEQFFAVLPASYRRDISVWKSLHDVHGADKSVALFWVQLYSSTVIQAYQLVILKVS